MPVQPTFEVLAVAVNSGLVAYPAAFTRVWHGAGGTIWRAVPPAGYVAAGDVFTTDDEEPELSAMVCLHGEQELGGGRPVCSTVNLQAHHRAGDAMPNASTRMSLTPPPTSHTN